MIKKLFIFALAMALGGVANAQVVWTYSGGSTTDPTAWEDADNWTPPSGNTYTTPSEQHVTSTEIGERSFINDDVTKIAITGHTVNKLWLTEEGDNTDDIYMGGTGCWLALDNATLNVGDDIKTGRDDMGSTNLNTKISLANGSALNYDECYTAFSSSSACTLNVLSGSTMIGRRIRMGHGGSETMTIDGVGSIVQVEESFRIGYDYESGNTNVLTVNVTNGAQIITGNSTGLRIAEKDYSIADMYVTGTTTNPCTISTSVNNDPESEDYGTAIGDLRVASGVDSVGTLTTSNCTITCADLSVGSAEGSSGTVTLNSGTSLNVGISTERNSEDLWIGDNNGTGAMTVNSGASVYVADDIYLADNSASQGTLTVNAGGSINCASSLKAADDGTGIMHVYGTVAFGGDASVAINEGSDGTLNIYDGADVDVGGILKTNDGTAASTGSIVMTGGDLTVDEALIMAFKGADGSEGTFTLSGGTVDIECNGDIEDYNGLILGNRSTDADATLNIDGGTMTVAGAIYMGSLVQQEDITGSDTGQLRLNINGGTLQAEDYIDEGTFTDHLITLTSGFLRINNTTVTEQGMEDLITAGDISCPGNYSIYTDGLYTVLTSTGMLIPGDTNGDNIVNDADATTVATNWGGTVTPGDYSSGDFNNDGVVNGVDASIMAANWGDHTGTESGTVPEPALFSIVLGALLFGCIRRKR